MYYVKHLLIALIPGILLGIAGFSFLQKTGILDGKSPQSIRAYVITSGSMQPTLPVGSVVISQTAEKYSIGDVITFKTSADSKGNVTHRVVEQTEEGYVTKGDANQDPDPIKIPLSQIQGKRVMHIPLVGYVVNFSKTPQGFIALIVIPATIVIYEELKTVFHEITKGLKKRKFQPVNNSFKIALALPLLALAFFVSLSSARFSDLETSINNVLGVATSYGQITASPSPSPSTSPEPTTAPTVNHLVINEFMPNPATGNEWVEIYNPTNSTVDLTGWSLKDDAQAAKSISSLGTIAAGGYAVFTDGTGWLNDSSADSVSLLDNTSNVIDTYSFNGTTDGISIGRNVDGSGAFVPCLAVSMGLTNNNICAVNP